MKLIVNGEPRDCAAADLESLFNVEAEKTGLESPQGIAIAVNGRIVRKRDWAVTTLAEDDRVEIVRAMQGG